MAIYSAIIEGGDASDYWDGTISWAGETSEANRDSKYSTRVYGDVAAWETARDGVATSSDVEYGVIIGPWTSVDSSRVRFVGWDTNTEAVLECPLTLPDGTNLARHDGIYGNVSNSYKLEVSLYNQVNDANLTVTIDGIQCSMTGTTFLWPCDDFTYLTLKNMVCKGSTGATVALLIYGSSKIENVIIHDEWDYGIRPHSGTVLVYNCTVSTDNHGRGVYDAGATLTIKNTASFNNSYDFDNSPDTIDYCASDDGDGTNAVDWDSGPTDWAANFNDYANDDYTPLNADLPDAGIGPSSDANVPTTDIVGNTRSGTTCTIGAFEYQAAGLEMEIAMHHYKMLRE